METICLVVIKTVVFCGFTDDLQCKLGKCFDEQLLFICVVALFVLNKNLITPNFYNQLFMLVTECEGLSQQLTRSNSFSS